LDVVEFSSEWMGFAGTLYYLSGSETIGCFSEYCFDMCGRRTDGIGRKADAQLLLRGEKATKLEEASRMLQKCFSACLNDR
jgi:hypothetical protein